jgi:hypothetical protein
MSRPWRPEPQQMKSISGNASRALAVGSSLDKFLEAVHLLPDFCARHHHDAQEALDKEARNRTD